MGKGPLLCLGDLVEDLAEKEWEQLATASLSEPRDQQPPSTLPNPGPCPTTESLEEAFERTYLELDKALKTSGHSWTHLTQELYTALTAATQLVAKVNSNVKILAERIIGLKLVLERANSVMTNLQCALQSMRDKT